MRRRQTTEFPPPPFVLLKAYSFGPPELCVTVLEVGDGYLYLDPLVGYISATVVKKSAIGGVQYKRTDLDVAPVLAAIKAKALKQGATLEAIQLLGTLLSISKEEEAEMATTKLARKGADTEGLKAAAKAAPVNPAKKGAAEPAKKRGNPEALAAARAARASGPDTRKINVLKKEHGARDGTKRADLLNKMFKHPTVQKAVDAGVSKSDISWAAREGYIELV